MSEKTEKQAKDAWDKFQILSSLLIAIVIAVVGWCINSTLQSREIALKNREVNVKLVEVAIGILQTKPDDAHKDTRMWAIAVMEKYSEIPFSPQAIQELKTNSLPVGKLLIGAGGDVMLDVSGHPITTP